MGIRFGNTPIRNVVLERSSIARTPKATPWVRNPRWLDMPTIASNESRFTALVAISSEFKNQFVFHFNTTSGDYTVDWGDGNTDTYSDNAEAEHTYNYSDLNANTEFTHSKDGRTYRQALISVTPQAGQGFTSLDLVEDPPNNAHPYANPRMYLDIVFGSPNLTSISYISSISGNFCKDLEHVRIVNFSDSMTSFYNVFYGMQCLRSIEIDRSTSNISNWGSTFYLCYALEEIPELDFSGATSLQSTFLSCVKLIKLPDSISNAVPTNMRSAFYNCSSLQKIPMMDTSNCTSFSQTFMHCRNLRFIPPIDTSSGTDFYRMFYSCISLEKIPKTLDTSSTNQADSNPMHQMFYSCYKIETVPKLTNVVGDIRYMFGNCFSLKRIPEIDFSNATNTSQMFTSCYTLESLPAINVTSSTSAYQMFYNCTNLKSIDSLPTNLCTDFNLMFYGCYSLTRLPDDFTTVSASDSDAFERFLGQTYSLTEIPEGTCSGFGNAGVTDYQEAFEGAYFRKLPDSFTGINNNADNITRMPEMFNHAFGVTHIPTIDASNVSSSTTNTFYQAYSLESGGILSGVTQNVSYRRTNMDREAMIAVFSGLGNASKTININETPAEGNLTDQDKAIATNKGWTIAT